MSEVIPEAAVEAAADWLPHSGDCESRPERECTCRRPRVDLMRAALEAAVPFIAAKALEDAAEMLASLPLDNWAGGHFTKGLCVKQLRARASAVRGEG